MEDITHVFVKSNAKKLYEDKDHNTVVKKCILIGMINKKNRADWCKTNPKKLFKHIEKQFISTDFNTLVLEYGEILEYLLNHKSPQ